jgi:hypothetical protein
VVAPLLWYVVGGLPAALAYRFLNTADAMLGYRDREREWLGKPAARLDDAANWLPARLSALLVIGCAWLAGGSSGQGWRIWRRDAGLTTSPNAGHPMSAAAGVLVAFGITAGLDRALGDTLTIAPYATWRSLAVAYALGVSVTFLTGADSISPDEVASGNYKHVGLVLWLPKDKVDEAVQSDREGDG